MQDFHTGGTRLTEEGKRVGCVFVLIPSKPLPVPRPLVDLQTWRLAAIETFESPSLRTTPHSFIIICILRLATLSFLSVLRCRSWLSRAAFCVVCYSCSHQR